MLWKKKSLRSKSKEKRNEKSKKNLFEIDYRKCRHIYTLNKET